MAELLTAAQMRAIEEAAIASGAVTGLELMERAGRGVVDAIFAQWPELAAAPRRAVVLCGPGNNGGDGFVVARLLRDWGWEVEVFLYGDPERLPPDARLNYERWMKRGAVEALSQTNFCSDPPFPGICALVVDALFGIGLSRGIDLPLAALPSETAMGQTHRLVAIDVPSGMCADGGAALTAMQAGGIAAPADLTVTFHTAKPGHVLADGPSICGKLAIVDIGLQPGANQIFVRKFGSPARLLDAVPQNLDKRAGHKFSHGHALVLSGPMGRSGAARLAARAALRVGAGLVTVAAPGSAMLECACQLTAIMLRKSDGAEGLAALLEDTRTNALCLGPGLGVDRARGQVPVALQSGRAVVLDADALTAFQEDPQVLFDQLHENAVLTPHGGEFARVFPDIAARLAEPATKGPAYSKLDATRDAADRAGCTVLFKGPDTVIASPEGPAAIHSAAYDRAAPWLATAGAGDVLAGLITGLLARNFAPQAAAEIAAWLHVEAAISFGAGLIAEDLIEEIPSGLGGSADYR